VLAIEYVALVAPEIFTPPFCHWYVGVGVPLAATVKEAEAPAVTVALAGWVVIAGAVVAALTVSVAAEDVAVPALFDATAVKLPASPATTLAMVYVALVAPEMFTPPFFH
jgi:hypothetical protein